MNRVKELVNYNNDIKHPRKWTGQNIGVAILDTGVAPHPDLNQSVRGFKDFVQQSRYPYDDNGHGTHIAGILCGSGKQSEGKYQGIATGIDLYMLKILDSKGSGEVKDMLKAMEWIKSHYNSYNIRIVNMSIGGSKNMNQKDASKLLKAVEELWDRGLTIVTSAGNHGPQKGSITIPGVSRYAITVGAADDDIFQGKSGQMDTHYSGRGPTPQGLIKPNLLAPGTYISSCNYNYAYNRKLEPYIKKSGTSMATPVVSGAIACLLSKNPYLSNVEVKEALKASCTDIGKEDYEQGWGVLDISQLLSSSS